MNTSYKILFFLVHPAHFHLFKNIIKALEAKGFEIKILITKKDVLEDLLIEQGWDYLNIFPEGRRSRSLPILLATALFFFKTICRLQKVIKTIKPSLLVGTDGTLACAGKMLGIPSMLFNEDDSSATPENYLTYPFATTVVLPECCDKGKWGRKRVSYNGYHELAYLHPNYFKPDYAVVAPYLQGKERFFILRLAELSASHDAGKKGVTDDIARQIISQLEPKGKVFITAERPLASEFEHYRLGIKPNDIFHFLYYAEMYIGDSQTMATEAAVLGTPSIRFNDFVGKLGYLDELEQAYGLTCGIKTNETEKLYRRIQELLEIDFIKSVWSSKRDKMIREKDDVVNLMVRTIERSFLK